MAVIECDLSLTLAETTATRKSAVVTQRQASKMQKCRKLGHPRVKDGLGGEGVKEKCHVKLYGGGEVKP